MPRLQGAFSCVVMTATKLIAFRDPNGFRPLCLGKTADDAYVVASESCALDSIGAHFVRDIAPGEIVVISKEGVRSITTHCGGPRHICVFEYIYFARPDSVIEGVSVQHARMRAGAYLAKEHPVDADIVIGVPDSGLTPPWAMPRRAVSLTALDLSRTATSAAALFSLPKVSVRTR